MSEVRLEFAAPEFFKANPKALKVAEPGTGRTYFLLKGRIVAVAKPEKEKLQCAIQ